MRAIVESHISNGARCGAPELKHLKRRSGFDGSGAQMGQHGFNEAILTLEEFLELTVVCVPDLLHQFAVALFKHGDEKFVFFSGKCELHGVLPMEWFAMPCPRTRRIRICVQMMARMRAAGTGIES
jgi:hypothetical protein